MSGEPLQGRRRVVIGDLSEPGDYCVGPTSVWVILPTGVQGRIPFASEAPEELWTVAEHEDGTITVSPSIDYRVGQGPGFDAAQSWHGYLEHGVWRSA